MPHHHHRRRHYASRCQAYAHLADRRRVELLLGPLHADLQEVVAKDGGRLVKELLGGGALGDEVLLFALGVLLLFGSR